MLTVFFASPQQSIPNKNAIFYKEFFFSRLQKCHLYIFVLSFSFSFNLYKEFYFILFFVKKGKKVEKKQSIFIFIRNTKWKQCELSFLSISCIFFIFENCKSLKRVNVVFVYICCCWKYLLLLIYRSVFCQIDMSLLF